MQRTTLGHEVRGRVKIAELSEVQGNILAASLPAKCNGVRAATLRAKTKAEAARCLRISYLVFMILGGDPLVLNAGKSHALL